MSDDVLRQPRTFWQWLTNQPGSIYTKPTVVVRSPSALDAIERSIALVHEEMSALRDDMYIDDNQAYHKLVDTLSGLHGELIRRSQQESANEANSSR